jgi:hypothetical protein
MGMADQQQDDGSQTIQTIAKMESEKNQSRVKGYQAMAKAMQEGFQEANQSNQKSAEVREGAAFKRTAKDSADFSRETQQDLQQ